MDRKKIIGIALCAKISWDLLFDSDSSDSDDENKPTNPKNILYYENTICKFNGEQFRVHFRILPGTMEKLYQEISNLETKYIDVSRGHPRITLEKQLLIVMTIWYLANTECFRSVSDRFGVSIYGCWKVVFDICKTILKLNYEKQIIDWPSSGKALETANHFFTKTRYPGIIGCIDGSHIAIPAPKEYPNSYVNRKKFHSVLLQGVCDEKMRFIDCYAGEAGSIHDSCLFRRSSLFRKISNNEIVFPEEQHMVGDLGYGLKPYLMTPFKDTGNLMHEHQTYNKAHSSARVTIERAFGLLKGRFRRLNGLNTRRPDLIPLLIMVGCILHNVCLDEQDNMPDEFHTDSDDGSNDPVMRNIDRNGNIKRNQILRILNT